ncbi:MAG: aminopeptidase P family protein [Dehalococcoidia bacterium]|nr:MAG: aminopeptidase P family protein [Dehalococcoidia bacterium]
MSNRLDGLRRRLVESEFDAILVSQSENRRYLSGFTGSDGFLLISQDRAVLATDFRYIEQAYAEAPSFDIFRISGKISDWFPKLSNGSGIRKLGFEEKDLSFDTHRQLTTVIGAINAKISLVPTGGILESLRAVKDEAELKLLEAAAARSDAALDEVLPYINPGISERELAWRLESAMRGNGSDPLPFETIVASGSNSTLPHAKPTDKALAEGEPVVIDLGARVGGYSSDCTRTICLGEEDSTLRRIYDIVLGAQLTAMATLQAGMTGEEGDRLGRTVISQAGYEESFGHGLGHGIGLAPHEEPRLGPNSSKIISNGMVFTIEPGIYIAGWGGVRIEDTVVLEEGKVRPLTRASKAWR